jgi:hypothetical protein
VESIIRPNKLACAPSRVSVVCDSCQCAKVHQLPFSHSTHVTSSPLELVHSDVWGAAITSVGGFKFYVSFLDDFSRFTWIYLLKRKSDVEKTFHLFQTHDECVLNYKIHALQSDWGGEYRRLSRHITSQGILHRVTCPHTSQQNGIAERKHRHIVETGLALLAHSSLPVCFWNEAFLTACYLINRMWSRTLQHSTPLELLHHEKPNYQALRAFGCACYPNLRPYNNHKHSFRSTQCVFLGYSSMHKGYKCLYRATGRIYISRDVIFDETLFSFAVPPTTPSVPSNSEPYVYNDHMRNYRVELLTPDAPIEMSFVSGGLGVSPIVPAVVPAVTPATASEAQLSVLDVTAHPPTTPAPGDSTPAMHAPDISTLTMLTAPGVATTMHATTLDMHVLASPMHGPVHDDSTTVSLSAPCSASAAFVPASSASAAL